MMLKRLLKRSSTNFWRMLCEGCVCVCVGGDVRGVVCVHVGRDVPINISMCVVSGVCVCVCVCVCVVSGVYVCVCVQCTFVDSILGR